MVCNEGARQGTGWRWRPAKPDWPLRRRRRWHELVAAGAPVRRQGWQQQRRRRRHEQVTAASARCRAGQQRRRWPGRQRCGTLVAAAAHGFRAGSCVRRQAVASASRGHVAWSGGRQAAAGGRGRQMPQQVAGRPAPSSRISKQQAGSHHWRLAMFGSN